MSAQKNGGFTLIELMVVIVIIAILATIGAVMYSSTQTVARDSKRIQDLQAIKTAIYTYKGASPAYTLGGSFPSWISPVSNAIYGTCAAGATNSVSMCKTLEPTYMSPVPRDPRYNTDSDDYLMVLYPNAMYLWAKLEKPPAGGLPSYCIDPANPTVHGSRNYCIRE